MGLTEERRRIIAAQPHLVTASGSSVLVNIAEPKIERLRVTFSPVQTGSGTPSPSNVRPIMGWATIMASIGTMPVDISLGGTYYGGTVDLVSGVMTVTMAHLSINGSYFSNYYASSSSASGRIAGSIHGAISGTGSEQGAVVSNICECKANGTPGNTKAGTVPFVAMSSSAPSSGRATFFVCFPDSYNITSLTDGKAWVEENGLTLAYRLATPETVTLTPQTIAALRGQQTVTSPAGAVEISYWTN